MSAKRCGLYTSFYGTHCVFVSMILKISSCCCFLDIDDIEKHMPGLLKVIVINCSVLCGGNFDN